MEMQHKVKLGLLNDLHKFDDREQHRLMAVYRVILLCISIRVSCLKCLWVADTGGGKT